MNKVPRWVFRYVGNKTFDFSSKKKDFLPKNDPVWPEIGFFCPLQAHLVPCWWVGWWLWRWLYLAIHLFTLFYMYVFACLSCLRFSCVFVMVPACKQMVLDGKLLIFGWSFLFLVFVSECFSFCFSSCVYVLAFLACVFVLVESEGLLAGG